MDNSGTQGALNAYLIPVGSPYEQNNGQISGYQFGYQNEDGVISEAQIAFEAVGNAQIGTAAIGTANIGTLTFNQISGGTINVLANLGTGSGGSIVLDGANKRIMINDGSYDRVLIGYLSGAF